MVSPLVCPPPRRTHFTSSSRPGRCCCQGPPKGEIKKGAVVSLQERWTPVFSLFFCLCHTCRKRGREGKNINVEEKKERKAPVHAVAFQHSTNNRSHPPPTPAPSTATPSGEQTRERGGNRGGPGPCDTESMRAQLHPQAE